MKKLSAILLAVIMAAVIIPNIAFAQSTEIETNGPLNPGKLSEVKVTVREVGTRALVEGAEVELKGCGVNMHKSTNSKGEAFFAIVPTETGKIKVTATIKDRHPADTEIPVVPDRSPPPLDLDPIISPTKDKQLTVTGRTRAGTEVYVGRIKASVDANGLFKATVQLVEGENHITVKASTQYASTTKEFTVIADTVAPSIIVEKFEKDRLVNVKTVTIKGRVDPGSKVTVNGVKATVVNDYWIVDIPVTPGKNNVTIQAVDQVGNETTLNYEIAVYTRKVIRVQVGNTTAWVDEVETILDAAPVIVKGSTLVPLRFIGEALGAQFNYEASTKTITITMDGKIIVLVLGQTTATIDGKIVSLSVPAQLVGGRTMVPVRFIADAFGATTAYDSVTKMVTVTREYLPQ